MKDLLIVLASFFAPLLHVNDVTAQKSDSCNVLKPEIAGIYHGKCKRGLAHGYGVAIGVDKYEGYFIRGKPYGYGIYTWKNGDVYEGKWALGVKNGNGKLIKIKSDSIIVGRWYKDRLILHNENIFSDYSIQLKQNVEKVIIIPNLGGVKNTIEVEFIRGTNKFRLMDDLMLLGNTGGVEVGSSFLGFTNVVFPFEGNINYSAVDKMGKSEVICTLRFMITKPGSWLVKLYF